jgi:hypothetical protein
MFILLQSFFKNSMLPARKSALLLLLAFALLLTEGCSKKIPCPDVTKETKKSKKKKKAKVVTPAGAAPADGEASENAEPTETASAALEEESSEEPVRKAPTAGAKNRYSKKGLLQKGKYKRLRSNPGKKVMRSKHGGSRKSKTKIKRNNVGPLAE